MLYIIHGADDYSVTREINRIKKNIGEAADMDGNVTVLDGTQATLEQIRVACETFPFLSEKRFVVINKLFSRFVSRRTGKSLSKSKKGIDAESIAEIINTLQQTTELVLVDEEIKTTNPLYKLVHKNAAIKAFPPLRGVDLKHWVANEINLRGGNISPTALNMMIRLIGSNLWILSNEIDKLITYTDGEKIEESHVRDLVSYTQQVNVFGLVDAIVEEDLLKAQSNLQKLIDEGESPMGLLAMLVRQIRLIVRVKAMRQNGEKNLDIRSKLRLNNEFVFNKVLDQSRHYDFKRLRQVYNRIVETDHAIKTGVYEMKMAMYILVAEICSKKVFS